MSETTPTPAALTDNQLVDALRALGVHSVSTAADGMRDAERGYLLGTLLFSSERHAANLILRDETEAEGTMLVHVARGFTEMASRMAGEDPRDVGHMTLSERAGSMLWGLLAERADLQAALVLAAADTGGARLSDEAAHGGAVDAAAGASMLTRIAGARQFAPGEANSYPVGDALKEATERLRRAAEWTSDTAHQRPTAEPVRPDEYLSSMAAFLLANGAFADVQIDQEVGEVMYAFTVARSARHRLYTQGEFGTWVQGFQDAVAWMNDDSCPHLPDENEESA
ncbi:hypothetical protein ACIRJS_16645 [Streptomyces sp. NPDC102340]|uniref:hypothetical protein n=1 Tax=unclassified Streptomyces TaxID=2593676 RepID=UPI003826BCE5